MKEEHFIEIFKTIWFIALLFAASKIPKHEDKKERMIFFCCWIIIAIITFTVMLGGCNPDPVPKPKPRSTHHFGNISALDTLVKEGNDENQVVADTVVIYGTVVDADFVEGTWQVIDNDSTILGEMRFFENSMGTMEITNSSGILVDYNAKAVYPWLITSNNQQYGRTRELRLFKKAKNQMTGSIKTAPLEGYRTVSSPDEESSYEVTFIKLY